VSEMRDFESQNNYEGNFISVEGVDGAGTTTLCENLKEELDEDWSFTREPSEGKFGRIIREGLESDSDATLSDFFMFLADRYDHSHSMIGPEIERGNNVITDRYNLSTFAYQTQILEESGISYPREYIKDAIQPWFINTDVTILLDVPMDEVRRRSSLDEKYENERTLTKARNKYIREAEMRDNVVVIDGTKSEQEILEESLEIIERL
jgi:dTMP kinase